MDTDGDGCAGPAGGYLDLQPVGEQELPGQDVAQKMPTLAHQAAYLKQSRLAGNPAFRKHDVNWTAQLAAEVLQLTASVNLASGLEHQFPHLYSQGGVGIIVVVEVQRDGDGVGVGVGVGVGDRVEDDDEDEETTGGT